MGKKVNIRKQIRLGDIYKYIVTGELVPIKKVNSIYFKNGELVVDFDNFMVYTFPTTSVNGTHDEKALRNAVKEINKKISEV